MKKLLVAVVFIIFLTLIPLLFREGPDDIVDREDIVEEPQCDTVDKETEATLHTISDAINSSDTVSAFLEEDESDIGKVKDRLNNTVLKSRESIQKEMQLVQQYRCVDMESPGKENLQMYEALLEYYYTMMPYEKDIQVENLDLKNTADELYSVKLIAETEDQKHFELTFYPEQYAYSDHTREDLTLLEEEKNILEEHSRFGIFMQGQLTNRILNILGGPFITSWGQAGGYYQAKTKGQREEDIFRMLDASWVLNMGFSVVQADSNAHLYDKKIQKTKLYPTQGTYALFERLEEVADEQDSKSYISYPEELIESEDWYELEDFLSGLKRDLFMKDEDLHEYIFFGEE